MRGYITVLFSISIALCLSLLVGLVYGVRENALRMRIREVYNIALGSSFAEYDTELWKQYGLVFVDAGYSNEAHSMILPEEHLRYCMQQNFNESIAYISFSKDLLKLYCINAETEGVRFATDCCGRALFNQAVRYMKFYYKTAYVTELFSYARGYEEQNYTEKELMHMKNDAIVKLEGLDSPVLVELKECARDAITEEGRAGLFSTLRLVLPSLTEVSSVAINPEALVSGRQLNEGKDGVFENKRDSTDVLLFKEYLVKKCGNYISEKEKTALRYELEYIIAGKQSDLANLESVVNRLLLMREAANIASLYADEKKQKVVNSIAGIIAMLVGNPEVEPAVVALINCVWAYFESVSDVKNLMGGKRVPLFKGNGEWESGLEILDIDGAEQKEDKGLSYEDYLRIMIYLGHIDKQIMRFADICELDVRQIEGNQFRLDYCFDYWRVTAYVISDYGYEYTISGKKDMEDQ